MKETAGNRSKAEPSRSPEKRSGKRSKHGRPSPSPLKIRSAKKSMPRCSERDCHSTPVPTTCSKLEKRSSFARKMSLSESKYSSKERYSITSRLEWLAMPRTSSTGSCTKPIRNNSSHARNASFCSACNSSLSQEESEMAQQSTPHHSSNSTNKERGGGSECNNSQEEGNTNSSNDDIDEEENETTPNNFKLPSSNDSPLISRRFAISQILNSETDSVSSYCQSLAPYQTPILKMSMNALQQDAMRLTNELAEKNQYISRLESKIREKEDVIKRLERERISKVRVRESQIGTSDWSGSLRGRDKADTEAVVCNLEKRIFQLEHELRLEREERMEETFRTKEARDSLTESQQRQVCYNELVVQLSSELDSKLVEIDQMKLDHEFQLERIKDSFESDFFLSAEKNAKECSSMSYDGKMSSNLEVKTLVSSLNKLKKECKDLRRSSNEAIQFANDALEQNCSKIINYVNEEVDSVRERELIATNNSLRQELEIVRSENVSLKAEIFSIKGKENESVRMETPQLKDENQLIVGQPSPLPTLESWAHFCTRFKEALTGGANTSESKRKLDSEGREQADKMLQELCFARNGTPYHRKEADVEDDDDSFIDAIADIAIL